MPSRFLAGAAALAIILSVSHAWGEAEHEHSKAAGKPQNAATITSSGRARLPPLGATLESVLAAGRQLNPSLRAAALETSAAAAKAGVEEGCMLLGHSCIVAPTGEIVALSSTIEDEVITAVCDLDRSHEIRDHIFNFKLHRQPQHYGLIAEM